MRKTDITAKVLRAVGIVLLLLSLVFLIYGLTTDGDSWKTMQEELTARSLKTNIADRLHFDESYFEAVSEAHLSDVKGMNQRVESAAGHFDWIADRARAAEAEAKSGSADAVINYFNGEFSYEDYLADYEQRENVQEQARIRELIEAFNTIATPVGKGGKKLPALAGASCEEDVEAFYADLKKKHRKEESTYVEFLESLKRMLDGVLQDGGKVTSIQKYLEESFDYNEYTKQLEEVRQEESAGEADSFVENFADFAQKKVNGEAADAAAYFEQEQKLLAEKYPEESVSDRTVFLCAIRTLLDSGSRFDGSYASVVAEYRAEEAAAAEAGFDGFLKTFSRSVVDNADSRKNIRAAGYLWLAISKLKWIICAGIGLLILSVLIRKLVNMILLKRQKAETIVDDPDVLLRVDHLKQYFRSGDYINKAVDDVSFFIRKGEVFGLVGESGCGKTTTGRTIINLYDPTDGTVTFHGLHVSSTQNGVKVLIHSMRRDARAKIDALKKETEDAVKKNPERAGELKKELKRQTREIRRALNREIDRKQLEALKSSAAKAKSSELYRSMRLSELKRAYEADMAKLSGPEAEERTRRYQIEKKAASQKNGIMTQMQMIFQDPIASIDPRMTVREIIAEGLKIRGIKDEKFINERVYEMLEMVGLVREHADRYPHEFSGGQRQRIGIARAVVMEPELIIADEPISALDVSIQAQVINLLNDLRSQMGLTILFIAHNLSVVKYFSDRIAVMYFGKIVEMADSDELFLHPLHPYTKSLLSAIPYPDPNYEKRRKRIEYHPETAHDYSVQGPTLREILPGHFILCNDAEFEAYRREIAEDDAARGSEAV